MTRIEELTERDLDAFVDIVANAYPGMKIFSIEERQNFKERVKQHADEDPTVHLYGVWRDGGLVGGMRLFDFTMRLFETTIPVGGVGLVAVDLLHKKEKVAKDLIAYFVRHYHDRGTPMVSLYAFRHDFYKQMGFGYGTKTNQYRLKPGNLPRRGTREHLRFLTPADTGAVHACYRRVYARTHGFFARSELFYQRMLEGGEHRVVGVKHGEQISGYFIFTFKPSGPDNVLLNDIHVHELIYEDRATLAELTAFLQTQADQIDRVIVTTQDEYFHHLPLDPRNGSDNWFYLNHETNAQGLGIMYRISDVRAVLRALHEHDFAGLDCRLRLVIQDTFFPQNNGATVLHVTEGHMSVHDDAPSDFEVRLDISEFSSLLMGSVGFRKLYTFGLAEISDARYIDTVDRLFRVWEKPICVTRF